MIFQFSEAASLYAENAQVVEQMRLLCEQEHERFVTDYNMEVSRQLAPHLVQSCEPDSGWVYFYVNPTDLGGTPSLPHVYFNPYKNWPLLLSKQLDVVAAPGSLKPPQREELRAAFQSRFQPPEAEQIEWHMCPTNNQNLAWMRVDLSHGVDMALLGEATARMLRFLEDEYQRPSPAL